MTWQVLDRIYLFSLGGATARRACLSSTFHVSLDGLEGLLGHDGFLSAGGIFDLPRHLDVFAMTHECRHSRSFDTRPHSARPAHTVEVVGEVQRKVKQHDVTHLEYMYTQWGQGLTHSGGRDQHTVEAGTNTQWDSGWLDRNSFTFLAH